MKKIVSVLFVGLSMLFLTNAFAQVKKKPIVGKVSIKNAKKGTEKNSVKKQLAGKEISSTLINDKSVKVKITTDSGVIIVKLYDSTPLHRDNFVKLVKENFYDSLLFHRVINGFMIQGGDPTSKNAEPNDMLGAGGGDMQRIPAEISPNLIHKKGALCAARDGNPEMASSACQFYIVHGRKMTDTELDMLAQQGRVYTPEQRLAYKTLGGTTSLDMQYTVFGEVIIGLDVIDKIASVQKGMADRPVGDVRMKMEVIK